MGQIKEFTFKCLKCEDVISMNTAYVIYEAKGAYLWVDCPKCKQRYTRKSDNPIEITDEMLKHE